ncbi:MAG: sulfurtransferase [Polyangiaceae bacterium]
MTSPSLSQPLVQVDELARFLREPSLKIVDVRWYLNGPKGRDAYEASHIEGALFLDVDGELADPVGPGRPGRHPLPSRERFVALLRRVGISGDHHVIAYDDMGGAIAARLWWMLHHVGHRGGVSVLDGGWQAWSGAGLPVASGAMPTSDALASSNETEDAETRGPFVKVDREYVAARLHQSSTLLIDARAPERYEGKVEPIDPRAGHIPGAKNAPFVGNLLAPGGRFRGQQELRERYENLGVKPGVETIVYCGSGVTACHDILALTVAGLGDGVRLYEGSWSDWSADPTRPIETGVEGASGAAKVEHG